MISDSFQEHAWVTKRGSDPLLSEAQNTGELMGPPTAAEMDTAITGNVANLMTVVSFAFTRFAILFLTKLL